MAAGLFLGKSFFGLLPKYHIWHIRDKVGEYLKINFMIHKKYFIHMSLIRIIDYFLTIFCLF